MNAQVPVRLLLLGLLVLPLAVGYATGDVGDSADNGGPAGSLDWFWTGLTAVIALVVGFLAGATMSRNGGIRLTSHRHRHRRRTEAGWNRIGQHIQAGTKQGLAEWRGAGHTEDPDWGDLSRRVEERVLEEMRKHHD